MMKIVSWNMGCGGPTQYRRTHGDAWKYLLEELRPDVALVQEALESVGSDVGSSGTLITSEDKNPDNGAAIWATSSLSATRVAVSAHDSFVAAADLDTPSGRLRVASLHLYPRSGAEHHANLIDLFKTVGAILEGCRFVAGGDINACRHYDATGGQGYGAFFDALHDRGFHDCHYALHGKEIQSYWGHSAKKAYQLDHLFVDTASALSVRSCDVVTTSDTLRLSDHSPIVLELA